MALLPPFNLRAWIDGQREPLRPPVGNKRIVRVHSIVMAVGGPSAHGDHCREEGPESFCQAWGTSR